MPRAQHAIDENKLNAFIGQMLSDRGGASTAGSQDAVQHGPGSSALWVNIADASEEEMKALVAQSQKRSAVFDIVTNPTNVFVTAN